MSAALTWKEALRAMAEDARGRAENSRPMPGGPSDPVTVAEKNGARYAFNVMAEELDYMACHHVGGELDVRRAIEKLRRLLVRAQERETRKESP